jgi:exopolyphosphatase/guanosine-5'-triphosphate,3'-diphosphate pyrophosphatase
MSRKRIAAAIDVGSHEIHMKIVELSRDNPPRVIESVRRTLAIGTDTYTYGRISQGLIDSCADVMTGLAEKIREYRIRDYRVVATSAFREAGNRLFAIDQIDRSSGLRIEVLSNSEERFYHMLAASEKTPGFEDLINSGTLILDIGAGSIQASVYDKGQFIFTQNMLLGSLRIRELLSDLERQTADFGSLMVEYVSGDLENYRMLEPKGTTYKHLIVLGGENIYLKMMMGLESEPYAMVSMADFDRLYQELLNMKSFDLVAERGVPADHAPLLLPAAMIIRKFLSFVNVNNLHLPTADLCDGILYEFAGRFCQYELIHDTENDTISACRHLARRFKTDRSHGQLVEKLVIDLFRQTSKLHRLPVRCQLLLQAAAILHDIGKYISMSRHTYRSYHTIIASEIIGVSLREQQAIAAIARFHSGPVDLEDPVLSALEPDWRTVVCKMIALFRMANALDTGHQQKIKSLEAVTEEKSLTILIESNKDITLERWNMEKNSDLFRMIFGIEPRVKIKRRRGI